MVRYHKKNSIKVPFSSVLKFTAKICFTFCYTFRIFSVLNKELRLSQLEIRVSRRYQFLCFSANYANENTQAPYVKILLKFWIEIKDYVRRYVVINANHEIPMNK